MLTLSFIWPVLSLVSTVTTVTGFPRETPQQLYLVSSRWQSRLPSIPRTPTCRQALSAPSACSALHAFKPLITSLPHLVYCWHFGHNRYALVCRMLRGSTSRRCL